MTIKTLHIITGLHVGGAETMLLRLIKYKPDLVSSTVVVSLTDSGKIGKILEKMGVNVIYLGMRNWTSMFSAVLRLKKLIKIKKPCIIHTWMYHANILGGVASFLAKNKNIIWSIRRSDFTLNESLSTFIVMKIGALFSNIIPKIIVCVADSGVINHEKYGYKANKMIVIPNGFELEQLKHSPSARKKIRKKLDINDKQVVIGCVGRFHESKDYNSLVASADEVIKCYKNVKYMLIGRNLDPQNTILMKWINQIGYADHFFLVGETSNVTNYMSAMDIFCLPSNTEGFPNVVGEAMASALPCVVTDVGDVRKITGGLAIIIPPGNKELLSKGLCDMLSMDIEERRKIGLMGREKIEKEYPLNIICEKYYNLYSSISNEVSNHDISW